jgi:iron complex outermembrane recepter protein
VAPRARSEPILLALLAATAVLALPKRALADPPSSGEVADEADSPVEVSHPAEATGEVIEIEGEPPRLEADTALRMNVPLREVPQTITSVSVEVLQERGTADMVSALQGVAGVNALLTYGGFDFLTIRGFGDFLVMDDGVRNERHIMSQSAPSATMAGVERVDVLRGPGAVSFGVGALGGIVNVVRKKPQVEPAYEFGVGMGSHGSRRASMGLTGPLTFALGRSLLYRFDLDMAAGSDFRGHEIQRTSGALTLHYHPAPAHRVELLASFGDSTFGTDAGLPTVDGRVPDGVSPATRYNTPFDDMRWNVRQLRAEYRGIVGGATLTNRLSVAPQRNWYLSSEYLTISADTPGQLDRDYLFFDFQLDPVSNQAQIERTVHALVPHRLVAGYDVSHYRLGGQSVFFSTSPIDLARPVEMAAAPDVRPTRENHATAWFHGVHVADHLELGPRVRVNLGLRGEFFSRSSRRDDLDPDTGAITMRGETDRRQFFAPTYRAGVVVLATDWLAPYVSSSTGFRPVLTVPADGRQLEPETGRQVELGARLTPLGDRLSIQASAFQLDKRNLVIARGMQMFDQAGSARSRGGELDAHLDLGPARLRASYAYTRASYTAFETAAGDDLSGNLLRFVPVHSATGWATYRSPHGLGAGLGGRYQSRMFADVGNTVPMTSYLIADAALFYQRGRVGMTLNAYNLLDRNPLDDRGWYFVSAINSTQLTPGPNRTFLGQLRLTY